MAPNLDTCIASEPQARLDEMSGVLAVLDRALALADMVDTLGEFAVYAMPSSSRLVALFEANTPSAPVVFRLWASSNNLTVAEYQPSAANGSSHVLIASRPNEAFGREIASLHLVQSQPKSVKEMPLDGQFDDDADDGLREAALEGDPWHDGLFGGES